MRRATSLRRWSGNRGNMRRGGPSSTFFRHRRPSPVRIELLGDQVYSLRFFDPGSQRSQAEMERCFLIPARLTSDKGVTILDYLPEAGVVVHKGIDAVCGRTDDLGECSADRMAREKLLSLLNVDISGVRGEEEGEVLEAVSNQDLREIFQERKTEIFQTLTERLRTDWSAYPYVYFFAANRHQAERLQEILRNYDLALPIVNDMGHRGQKKEWAIVVGPLRKGFRTANIIVLTEEDIVGPKKRTAKQKWEGADEFLSSFKDLSVGDYVVHVENGIGVYKGLKKLKVDGCEKDFLLIEYQDEDRLYVPVDSLELVQKYIGGEKSKPKIDKLGTGYWRNAKSRVKKYVEDIAKELIQFYAEREAGPGARIPAR